MYILSMARKSKKTLTGRRARQQERRLLAADLFDQGFSAYQVAKQLKVSRQAASTWCRSYEKEGREGLIAKKTPGPQPKFNAAHQEQLRGFLLQGAKAHGYANELWTLPRIGRLIQEKFDLQASNSEVWRLLRAMGWSPQKPVKRARERNEDKIAEWKKEKWPQILQKGANGEADDCFRGRKRFVNEAITQKHLGAGGRDADSGIQLQLEETLVHRGSQLSGGVFPNP